MRRDANEHHEASDVCDEEDRAVRDVVAHLRRTLAHGGANVVETTSDCIVQEDLKLHAELKRVAQPRAVRAVAQVDEQAEPAGEQAEDQLQPCARADDGNDSGDDDALEDGYQPSVAG